MIRRGRVLETPFGPLTVIVDERGVVASGFRPQGLDDPIGSEPDALLDVVQSSVAAWASGADLGALGAVPLALAGEGFRVQVWRAMREVPPGATASYGQVAAAAGRPGAARAAGTACATNPVAPFVPCHRIVRADGSLGEYGFGPGLKRVLLEHEGAPV